MRPLNVFSYGGGPASAIIDHFPGNGLQRTGLVSRQSLISAMRGPSDAALTRTGTPPAAARVLQADIKASLRDDLEAHLSNIDIVLWDVFDERFGVDALEDGTYITRSPERVKHVSAGSGAMRTIPFGTDEHFELWCASAGKFLEFLESKGLISRTYLLDVAWAHTDENGLDAEVPFGPSSKEANDNFARYAAFIRGTGINVLSHSKTWTSRDHRWGPAPYNLHDAVYRAVAKKLAKAVPAELLGARTNVPARDTRHQAPILKWASLADFDATREGRTHHRIAPAAGQDYGLCSLLQNTGSDTLLVISHGALNREKYSLPRFEWLATLEGRPESLMFLADTALEPHDDLELAWFTGNAREDLTEQYAEFVKEASRQLGVKKILFMGGSGGGFASLALASRTPGSRALVFNPQTNIRKYWRKSVRNYLSRLYPEFSSERQLEALGARCDLIAAYGSAPNFDHQILYVQNDDDPHHLDNHLGPFAAALGIEPRSGVSADGNVRLIVEHFATGHNMPYRTALNPFVDLALAGWGKSLDFDPGSAENLTASKLWNGVDLEATTHDAQLGQRGKTLLWLDTVFCDAETDIEILDRYLSRFLVTLDSIGHQRLPESTDIHFVIYLSRDKAHIAPAIENALSTFPEFLGNSTRIHFYDHPVHGYGVPEGSHVDLIKNPNKQPGRREKLFRESSQGVEFQNYRSVIRISMDDDDLYRPGHFEQVLEISDSLLKDAPDTVSAVGLYQCSLAHITKESARLEHVSFSRVIPGNKFFVTPAAQFQNLPNHSPWSIPEYIDDEAVESFQRRGVRLTLARNNRPTFVYMRRGSNLSGQSKDHFVDAAHGSRNFAHEADLVASVIKDSAPLIRDRALDFAPLPRILRLNCQRTSEGAVRAETNFSRVFGPGYDIAYYLLDRGERIDTKWYSSSDVVFFDAPLSPCTVRAFVRKDGQIVDRISSRFPC